MQVHHATSKKKLDSILVDGLKPRGKNPGNWSNNVDGNNDCVYLSCDPISGEFHGFRTAMIDGSDGFAFVKIDLTKIDQTKLRPDENYYQRVRGDLRCDFEQREIDKKRALVEWDAWKDSLSVTGLISHVGNISPENLEIEEKALKDSRFYCEELVDPNIPLEIRVKMFQWVLDLHNFHFSTLKDLYGEKRAWLLLCKFIHRKYLTGQTKMLDDGRIELIEDKIYLSCLADG